jgi:hypothetical protein
MDPLTLLTGAGILTAGYAGGRVGRARRTPKPKPPPKSICGCGHHFSYHTPGAGVCKGTNRRTKYSDAGSDLGFRDFPCTCQTFSGPTPYPEYVALDM